MLNSSTIIASGAERYHAAAPVTLARRLPGEQMEDHEGDALTLAAIALGGIALVWLGSKVIRLAFRLAGPISTILTVAGAVYWLREELRKRGEESA
jgi:ABC-type enterochelin transport system permease subunit